MSCGFTGAFAVLVVALCLGLFVVLGRPEGEVVAQQLHDEGGVLVALLRQGVQLSDRIVERRLGGEGALVPLIQCIQ